MKFTWRTILYIKHMHWLWLCCENMSPSHYHRFPKQKQDLWGHKFKKVRQAENSCDAMADTPY